VLRASTRTYSMMQNKCRRSPSYGKSLHFWWCVLTRRFINNFHFFRFLSYFSILSRSFPAFFIYRKCVCGPIPALLSTQWYCTHYRYLALAIGEWNKSKKKRPLFCCRLTLSTLYRHSLHLPHREKKDKERGRGGSNYTVTGEEERGSVRASSNKNKNTVVCFT